MMNLSPFFTARVFMDAASLPLDGSLKQNAHIHSPDDILGRYVRFGSSVPSFQMETPHSIMLAPHASVTPRSCGPLANPSLARHVSTHESPAPPYSTG